MESDEEEGEEDGDEDDEDKDEGKGGKSMWLHIYAILTDEKVGRGRGMCYTVEPL